jgi:hypothetical protein
MNRALRCSPENVRRSTFLMISSVGNAEGLRGAALSLSFSGGELDQQLGENRRGTGATWGGSAFTIPYL